MFCVNRSKLDLWHYFFFNLGLDLPLLHSLGQPAIRPTQSDIINCGRLIDITMAGEKKRRRLRRSKCVETLNQNQIPPTTPPQATLDQPSISIDTDRNLDLDLRQTGSRSIDQPRSDPDHENIRSSRSPQRRPSFRSATAPQEVDRPIRIRSTSPLPPPPYIIQAASTLTPPTAPNHDNANILPTILGEWQRHAKILAHRNILTMLCQWSS